VRINCAACIAVVSGLAVTMIGVASESSVADIPVCAGYGDIAGLD
jgi:hypothetical protein